MERPDFPSHVDSSMRKSFVACPTQAYYQYFLHLHRKGGSIHLHFGGAFARGLELFRKKFYGERSTFDAALKAGVDGIIHFWGDYEPPINPKMKTLENCIVCLYDYFVQYPPLDDPVQPYMTENGPAVEFTFAVPIPGTKHPQTGDPILYTGRFDMLATYQGGLFINDEKTAASLGPWWAASYRLASQFTGYTWAAQTFGYPILGSVVRGISPLAGRINHLMLIEQRPQWMIDRWLAQLTRDIDRMIGMWETGIFDYNIDGSCGSYGGCEFLDLCATRHPQKYIDMDFEVVPWDPLDKEDG